MERRNRTAVPRSSAACWMLACVWLLPRPIAAQWLPAVTPSQRPAGSQDAPDREVPAADLAFLGALGGAVACIPGAAAGALTYQATHGNHAGGLDAAIGYAALGCATGAAIGLAGSVHLANHRRGNFWLDLLAASGVAVLGLSAGAALDAPGAAAWLIAIAMVGGTVATEKGAEHRTTPDDDP